MTAPTRPAYYYDGIFGRDEGGDPAEESGWLVDDFVGIAKTFPDWVVEGVGIEVALLVLEHRPLKRALIGWQAAAGNGTIEISPDASGYLLVVGRVGDQEVFRAYLDRPYEEFEMWPLGATPEKDEEGPGRMGKHRTWVSLRAAAWPALAPLANPHGAVNIAVDEAKLRPADA